ncbi:ComEC family competence protein [Candidatus Parcubacteria bacterium]|nr:ComEC family competence protein [Candidatus Parcubacteria bacterium]
MHRSQVFGYLLVAFLFGVGFASFVSLSNGSVLITILAGTIIITIAGYQKTFSAKGLLIGVLILSSAFGIFCYNQSVLNHSVLREFANKEAGQKGVPVLLRGYITEIQNNQIIFKAKELEVADRVFNINEEVLLVTRENSALKMGQTISVNGPVRIPENFSDFNYQEYLEHKGIYTTMLSPRIQPAPSIQLSFLTRIKLSLYSKLFEVRTKFESGLAHAISEPYSSYLLGVLLGNKTQLPDSLVQAFNTTGTTHILAVSGYNITIIAEALLAVLVFFTRRRNAFWLSLIIILCFTLLTGATASVVRAAVMGSLLLCANSYGRLYDPKNSILLAAAVMVWHNSSVLRFDIGFQLSFLAVLGLFYIYPILKQKTFKLPAGRGIKELLLMSLSAQLAVAPLLAYYFHSFSVVSLPTNLLVLPVVPAVMLLGFLSGLAGLVLPVLGTLVGSLAWVLSAYQLRVITLFASLPHASLSITLNSFWLGIIYVALVCLVWKFYTKLYEA